MVSSSVSNSHLIWSIFRGSIFFSLPIFSSNMSQLIIKRDFLNWFLKQNFDFYDNFCWFFAAKPFFFKYCVVHLVCSFAVRLLILGSVIYELLLVVLPFMCRSRASLKSYRFWLPMTVTNLLVLRDAELVHLAWREWEGLDHPAVQYRAHQKAS